MAVAGYHFTGAAGVTGVILLRHVWWADAGPLRNAIGWVGLTLLPGHAALMTFFVISGFVLRVSLENGPRTVLAATTRFLIARLFRIYPILAVGVLLAAFTTFERFSPGRLAVNLLLLDVSMNSHLWALQVEMLMVPVILALFFLERRWGPWMVAGVALATTGLAFAPRWAVWPPLSVNLFAFAVGITLPSLGRRFAGGLSNRTATLWVVGSVAVLLTAGPSLGVYARFTSIIETYVAASLLSLVAYRLDLRVLRALDARCLRKLGAASGSYYVLHMATLPVGVAVATAVIPTAGSVAVRGVLGLGLIAVWVVAIAPLMVCVSLLVEVPGIALGRRLVRSLRWCNREPAVLRVGSAPSKDGRDVLAGDGEVDLRAFNFRDGNADHVAVDVDHRAA